MAFETIFGKEREPVVFFGEPPVYYPDHGTDSFRKFTLAV